MHQVLPRGDPSTAPALDTTGEGDSIHARLRRETKTLHAAVERKLDLTSPGLSKDAYRRTLQAFYGFHLPLESRIRDVAAAVVLPRLAPIDRARLLERDLLALGLDAAEIGALARCADLPSLDSVEAAAGCLYVLEGAALGARAITRLLAGRLGIGADTGAAFFATMAAGAAGRWSRVLAWLDEVAAAASAADTVATAARATFAALERWLPDREAAR